MENIKVTTKGYSFQDEYYTNLDSLFESAKANLSEYNSGAEDLDIEEFDGVSPDSEKNKFIGYKRNR